MCRSNNTGAKRLSAGFRSNDCHGRRSNSQADQPLTARRGRPPLRPLARAAAVFAADRALPPDAPSCAAIHLFEPNTPCISAGTYRSASNLGQCRPNPLGVISISARSSGRCRCQILSELDWKSQFDASVQPHYDPRPMPIVAYTNRAAGTALRFETCLGLLEIGISSRHGSHPTSCIVPALRRQGPHRFRLRPAE